MSIEVVRQVKAELEAAGVDLTGPCGAFTIVKHVAWRLRSTGAGLLDKPGGNQCEGYATDIIAYPNGDIVDCLQDAGGANGPMWGEGETVDPARYRPAFDPGPIGEPVPPVPGPDPDLEPRVTALEQRVSALEGETASLRAEVANLAFAVQGLAQRIGSLDGRLGALEAKKIPTGGYVSLFGMKLPVTLTY